jgi:hypothetical protein
MSTKIKTEDLTDDQMLWVLANKCWLEFCIAEEIRLYISSKLGNEVEVPDELLQGE